MAIAICIISVLPVLATESSQPVTTESYNVTVYFNYSNNNGLALYANPNKNSARYTNIPDKTALHIETASNGWGRVTYNGITGWVELHDTKIEGDYPTPWPTSGFFSGYYTVYNTNGEGLELRSYASTKCSTFGPLYDGTVFKAEAWTESSEGKWVFGEYNGHYGWCNTAYLRSSSQAEISNYEAQKAAQQAAQQQAAQQQAAQQQETQTQPQPVTEAQPQPVTEVQPEPVTEAQPQPVTEVQPEPVTEAQPQPVTEAQPEPATQAQSEPAGYVEETFPEDNGYISAYMEVLNANREAIYAYDWQKWQEESRSVVLSNVYTNKDGVDVPELIYVVSVGEDMGIAAELHVVTYENGEVRTLFAESWTKAKFTGGYSDYYLFRMAGKPSLYLYTSEGDDGGVDTYGRLDETGDGSMVITELFRYNHPYDGNNEYFQKGEAISEEQYNSGIQIARDDTTSILMYTNGCGDFVENYVAQYGSPAMTVDEALTYLSTLLGSNSSYPAEEPATEPANQPAEGSGGVVITF